MLADIAGNTQTKSAVTEEEAEEESEDAATPAVVAAEKTAIVHGHPGWHSTPVVLGSVNYCLVCHSK